MKHGSDINSTTQADTGTNQGWTRYHYYFGIFWTIINCTETHSNSFRLMLISTE